MKQYTFSLGRVLRVRRLQEEVAAQQLRDATRAARRREQDAIAASERYETTVAAAAGLRGCASTAFGLRELDLAFARDVFDAQHAHEAAVDDVGTATAEWTTRKQAVAGLERLDESARAQHTRDALAEEVAVTDDLVASHHTRKERHA